MKSYIVEFIGTFFLVMVVGLCVIAPGAGTMAALAIGTTLMVMVYAGGHISGGHYNPAVTLGVWMRGKCETKDVPFYMIAQVIGGIVAAFAVIYLRGYNTGPLADLDIGKAFLVEFLFTFALVYVVLNTATSEKTAGNSYFGLAIGFTVMLAAYAAGDISGGAFNPAVAIGITMMKLSSLGNLWLFLVANLAGGAAAALVFKHVNPAEEQQS